MPKQPETSGFNHVATMTSNLERYLDFYGDVFGAKVISIMEEHGDHPRMAIVDMGGDSASMSSRFLRIRSSGIEERWVGEARSTTMPCRWNQRRSSSRSAIGWWTRGIPGEVTQFGPALLSVFFRDPDGGKRSRLSQDPLETRGDI